MDCCARPHLLPRLMLILILVLAALPAAASCAAPCLGSCPLGLDIRERMTGAHELLTLS